MTSIRHLPACVPELVLNASLESVSTCDNFYFVSVLITNDLIDCFSKTRKQCNYYALNLSANKCVIVLCTLSVDQKKHNDCGDCALQVRRVHDDCNDCSCNQKVFQ